MFRTHISFLFVLSLIATSCAQDPLRTINVPDGSFGDGGNRIDLSPHPLDGSTDGDDAFGDARADVSDEVCKQRFEVCNNVDDNCNGSIDEGIDKLNDTRFCENCRGCMFLWEKHAIAECVEGTCKIKACQGGWADIDDDVETGCEAQCTPTGVEVCDGIDNDCDGTIDEGLNGSALATDLAAQMCKSLGACKGTPVTCQGKNGWVCQYAKTVERPTCTKQSDCGTGGRCVGGFCLNLVLDEETICDNIDGDCDGLVDDPWVDVGLPTAIGKSCELDTPPKLGVCHRRGEYRCDSSKTKTTCVLVDGGKSPSAERCNNLDDDCDGKVDEEPMSDHSWITIPSGGGVSQFQIFAYEASRPDATVTQSGTISGARACSSPSRIPWANISKEEAQAACVKSGARICTIQEWQRACRGGGNTLYPYGNVFDNDACNGRAYTSTTDQVLPTHQPSTCISQWGASGNLFNMSGNVKEWTATSFSGLSPIDYQIRGGAYDTPSIEGGALGLSCNYELPAPNQTLRLDSLGFRCCR